jgi:hypothetical protein
MSVHMIYMNRAQKPLSPAPLPQEERGDIRLPVAR